jgi:hypothetical protein
MIEKGRGKNDRRQRTEKDERENRNWKAKKKDIIEEL